MKKFENFDDHIVKHPLKEAFDNVTTGRYEEEGMSPWVANELLPKISEQTGMDLSVEQLEQSIGDFRPDIICKDNNDDRYVVIENQFDQSDHAHLGKVITYMANIDAKAFIWISEDFRPEHKRALNKLNEITSDDYNFYGILLEYIKIGEVDTYKMSIITDNEFDKKNSLKINKSEATIAKEKYYKELWDKIKSELPDEISKRLSRANHGNCIAYKGKTKNMNISSFHFVARINGGKVFDIRFNSAENREKAYNMLVEAGINADNIELKDLKLFTLSYREDASEESYKDWFLRMIKIIF